MIKLQDFARQQGVTDRQVQRLIKKYAAELEGHVERKGPNGTWLDDEACEILKSKMKSNPIVLSDASQQREIERLRGEVDRLKDELLQEKDKISALKDEMTTIKLENKELQLRLELKSDKKWWQIWRK